MKVWSRTLTTLDLRESAKQVNDEFPGARVYLGTMASWPDDNGKAMTVHEGPRTRRIDHVHLRSETGVYHANTGTQGAAREMAASWTEWGWFLARVFDRDPDARCGDYRGVEDFNTQTNDRFIDPRSPRERQVKRALRVVA